MIVRPELVDFGTEPTGGQASQMLTICNDTEHEVTHFEIAMLGSPFWLSGFKRCSPVLVKGDYCQVTVTFAPHQSGEFTGGIMILGSGKPGETILKVPLQGIAVHYKDF